MTSEKSMFTTLISRERDTKNPYISFPNHGIKYIYKRIYIINGTTLMIGLRYTHKIHESVKYTSLFFKFKL